MAVAKRTTGKYLYEETIAGKAVLYISYKVADGSNADYVWPYFIKDYALYELDDPCGKPCAVDDAEFEDISEYLWIEDLRTSSYTSSFTSFEELAKFVVEAKVECLLDENEGDWTALAIGNRYKVTIFNGPKKIYEETI